MTIWYKLKNATLNTSKAEMINRLIWKEFGIYLDNCNCSCKMQYISQFQLLKYDDLLVFL